MQAQSLKQQRFSRSTIYALTALTMVAFAGNSLLCRVALRQTAIDAASFTAVRLISGGLVLYCIVNFKGSATRIKGDWLSAIMLFSYAAGFSYAYLALPTATGALLLFAAVQVTMSGYGLCRGERLTLWQGLGLAAACAGVVGLLLPGLAAPPAAAALLMLAAGVAWGVYSIRGRSSANPTGATAGNFIRTLPLVIILSAATSHVADLDPAGLCYAIVSGALTSGVGYALWYAVLPSLRAISAAAVQLSVPPLAAIGGILLLHEPLTSRLLLASVAILGGIALTIFERGQ